MSAALVSSNVTSAVSAMGSGDWSSAINYLTQAAAYIAAMPTRRAQGDTELEYDSTGIERLIKLCKENLAAANGIGATGGVLQFQKIRYVGEESC